MSNEAEPASPWAAPAGPPKPAGAPPGSGQPNLPSTFPPPGYPPQGYPPPGYPLPPSGFAYAPVVQRTNGLAIASMVLGILWIYWIGSILALIFGFVARSQIKQRHESGKGMAVAGIVLGCVGVATLVVSLIVGATILGGS